MHDDGLNWVIIELGKDFFKSVISNPFAPGGILQMLCSKWFSWLNMFHFQS